MSLFALGAAAVTLAACSSGSTAATTVVETVVVPGGSTGATGAAPGSTNSITPGSASSSGSQGPSTAASSGTSGHGGPAYATPAGTVVKTEPDGFTITKLAPGQKPPQFVVISFDGVGWHEKWQYWRGIEAKVPFHFTGFLSGTYMLSDQTKNDYTGPGHLTGKSSISWNAPSDLPVEIGDLNDALAKGDEIGTHFNGHFCSDNPPGGNAWNADDWNNELDQFFSLVKNVDANNKITDKLNLPADEIKGERTPCLEGHKADLYPALTAHHMIYDSSFTHPGISWPTQSDQGNIWQMGMAEFPMHGTGHTTITMDFNFWAQQENNETATPAKSKADSEQVVATYQDMYKATFNGNRAPLILGNHFNDWNNNAYSDAIGNFALQTCGKAQTYCVPFRDVIDWMTAQDPAVLKQLQDQPAELGGCPYTKFPHCDGTIKY